MDGKNFLLSSRLLLNSGLHEADFRSAISRAYYACFLVTRKLAFDSCDKTVLIKAGFKEEKGIKHESIIKNLKNSKDTVLQNLGDDLASLRGIRVDADYDMLTPVSSSEAKDAIDNADNYLMSLAQIDSSRIKIAVEEYIHRTHSSKST